MRATDVHRRFSSRQCPVSDAAHPTLLDLVRVVIFSLAGVLPLQRLLVPRPRIKAPRSSHGKLVLRATVRSGLLQKLVWEPFVGRLSKGSGQGRAVSSMKGAAASFHLQPRLCFYRRRAQHPCVAQAPSPQLSGHAAEGCRDGRPPR